MSSKKPTHTLALGPAQTGPDAVEARTIARYGTAAAATGTDIQKIVDTAKRMQHSGIMPGHIDSPEKAVIIGLRGAELGIPLIQAWHSMYVIQGRCAMEAKTMIALAYRLLPTFDFQIIALSRAGCKARARRSASHSWVELEYDKKDAEAAGLLSKGVWRQHPKAMFLARCQSMLVRAVAPDTFQGLYTGDEAQALPPPQIEEGAPLESAALDDDAVDAEYAVQTEPAAEAEQTDGIDSMTRQEIVDALKEGGLHTEAKAARAALELDPSDKSVGALRAIYRHIMAQMP